MSKSSKIELVDIGNQLIAGDKNIMPYVVMGDNTTLMLLEPLWGYGLIPVNIYLEVEQGEEDDDWIKRPKRNLIIVGYDMMSWYASKCAECKEVLPLDIDTCPNNPDHEIEKLMATKFLVIPKGQYQVRTTHIDKMFKDSDRDWDTIYKRYQKWLDKLSFFNAMPLPNWRDTKEIVWSDMVHKMNHYDDVYHGKRKGWGDIYNTRSDTSKWGDVTGDDIRRYIECFKTNDNQKLNDVLLFFLYGNETEGVVPADIGPRKDTTEALLLVADILDNLDAYLMFMYYMDWLNANTPYDSDTGKRQTLYNIAKNKQLWPNGSHMKIRWQCTTEPKHTMYADEDATNVRCPADQAEMIPFAESDFIEQNRPKTPPTNEEDNPQRFTPGRVDAVAERFAQVCNNRQPNTVNITKHDVKLWARLRMFFDILMSKPANNPRPIERFKVGPNRYRCLNCKNLWESSSTPTTCPNCNSTDSPTHTPIGQVPTIGPYNCSGNLTYRLSSSNASVESMDPSIYRLLISHRTMRTYVSFYLGVVDRETMKIPESNVLMRCKEWLGQIEKAEATDSYIMSLPHPGDIVRFIESLGDIKKGTIGIVKSIQPDYTLVIDYYNSDGEQATTLIKKVMNFIEPVTHPQANDFVKKKDGDMVTIVQNVKTKDGKRKVWIEGESKQYTPSDFEYLEAF